MTKRRTAKPSADITPFLAISAGCGMSVALALCSRGWIAVLRRMDEDPAFAEMVSNFIVQRMLADVLANEDVSPVSFDETVDAIIAMHGAADA